MRSLRTRVTAVAVLAVVGVLSVAGAVLVLTQRASLVESLDERLDREVDAVAARLQSGQLLDSRDLPVEDVVVEVVGPGGELLARSQGLTGRLPQAGAPADGSAVTVGSLPGTGEQGRLVVHDVDGTTVRVAGSLDDVRDSTAALAGRLLVAVPISAAVLAGIVWWAVGGALRPVEAIRAEADRISGAHPDQRVPLPAATEEITRLGRTMNAMLDRLQASSERQRRFVADASHELRSPLARMRTELEVDRVHPESADPAGTAASVLDETVRLQRLVDDLLLLARADAGAPDRAQSTSVDLDELVERLARRLRGQGSGPRVDTRAVEPVQVRGDPAQLERLVVNLLENAVRHARAEIVLTVREVPGAGAELTVRDDGPGIPREHRERVFERFTRLEQARSPDGGTGLGLAIARDIAERHGGTVTIADLGPPGVVLVLALPIAGDVVDRR